MRCQDRHEPCRKLVRRKRTVVTVPERTMRLRTGTRLNIALRRLILGQHAQGTGHEGTRMREGRIHVSLRPPEVSAPDKAIALGSVRKIGVCRPQDNVGLRRHEMQRRRSRRNRRKLTRANAGLPERRQARVRTGEVADDRLFRMRAAIHEPNGADGYGRVRIVKLETHIAQKPLLERRRIGARIRNREDVKAVYACRKNRQIK